MNHGMFYRFLVRWLVSSLGLWIASSILRSNFQFEGNGFWVVIFAGLILALINAVLRPIAIILSLPAILFSLGIFMLIVNGAMVWLVSFFYPSLHISSFWMAILAGIIIGLVNYLVTAILEIREK
jgi:putative membrane protein